MHSMVSGWLELYFAQEETVYTTAFFSHHSSLNHRFRSTSSRDLHSVAISIERLL